LRIRYPYEEFINGLPSGKTVIVSVTARNPAGKTLPTNSTILVA
jgi:hypothetical protein